MLADEPALMGMLSFDPINGSNQVQDAHLRFDDLVTAVQRCRACPSMLGRTRVLSRANGALSASVLFVAEAPGRLGADRTGIPLSGDRTGDNFDKLLGAARWSRSEVFVSNAVLCNPRDRQGNNRTPTALELSNCSAHLGSLIAILQPKWVVTLGVKALEALELLAPHGCKLRTHVGVAVPWYDRFLVPLYHPGSRALIRRPLVRQARDFQRLRRLVDGNLRKTATGIRTMSRSRRAKTLHE